MRKPLFCSSIRVEDMTSPNQNFDVVGESRVERVCKRLSSPLTKKKIVSADRLFGISLVELLRNNPGDQDVPLIVSKICEYIESNGFHHEGLFRVNGSARAIEKLRTSFERTGVSDANLEDVGDVMAAAGLLKQFLRGLPEAVITNVLHGQFIAAYKDHHNDSEECIRQLKKLVEQLPIEHFNLLKYLMGFLVRVAQAEEYNRMNCNALGIIFGPNLFRVPDGDEGLREQAITNDIVTKFIKDYSAIFEADSATAPVAAKMASSGAVSKKSTPLRLPLKVQCAPPQGKMDVDYDIQHLSAHNKENLVLEPCNSSKMEVGRKGGSSKSMAAIEDTSNLTVGEPNGQENKYVEIPMSKSVNKHFYGDFDFIDGHDPPRPPPRIKHKKMDLSPDGAAMSKLARSNSEETPKMEDSLTVPPTFTLYKCSSHENVLISDGFKDSTQPLATKHRDDHTENKSDSLSVGFSCRQDHPLTPLNIDTSTHATPDLRKKDWGHHYDSDIDASEARRSVERLQYRSTSSKNRRIPSLRSSRRCLSMEVVQRGSCDESHKENDAKPAKISQKHFQKRSTSVSLVESPSDTLEDDPMADASSITNKPRLWLLDLHAAASAGHERGLEDGTSPSSAGKPCIPPLDFSILHEHGDGSDPIPTNQLRASWPFAHHQQNGDDDVMLSPRTSSLEKKSSFLADHNIPPSPPVEQEVRKSNSITMKDEDAIDLSFKVLNKRISTLKRKIKKFEDAFEDEFGYRPSHAEKMARSDIKRYLSELVKARKELKQLKEDTRMASIANSGILTSPSNGAVGDGIGPVQYTLLGSKKPLSSFPTMKESLDDMLVKLSDERHMAERPDELEHMSRQQVLDEKLAMQKSLLQFESLHGHPSTKGEKELMKPVYERYRNVKRLAAKANSQKLKESSMELQPILEHVTMDFTQASPKHHCQTVEEPVESPVEQHVDENVQPVVNSLTDIETTQFPVPDSKKGRKKKHLSHVESCNLHELSLEELMEQEWKVRCEKKRLRRILKEFEEEFQKQTGRKAQREDRAPMDSVYLDYKQVKAKLKLLEALLTKHEHHYTI